jgi:lipopolysaccharide/colanic/teichoic acid biosynthesis glycosyltransferase
MYIKIGKRIFDFLVAFIGIILLLVPIIITALIVKVFSGSPVFFTQDRVGKDGKIFQIKKFRTMRVRDERDSTITVAGDDRITPVGRYLRRWKLDELPQLWNVLVGEMSFVGPRPDVPGYVDKLEGTEAGKLLLLRPGITGPATLAYRNEEEILSQVSDPIRYNDEIIYPDKVRLNLQYLEDCSLSTDIYYIWKTIFS